MDLSPSDLAEWHRRTDPDRDDAERFDDPVWRLTNLYSCLDDSGNVVHIVPTDEQRLVIWAIHVWGWQRIIIPKARQLGMSLVLCLIGMDLAAWNEGWKSALIDKTEDDAKKKLREKAKLGWESVVPELRDSIAYTDATQVLTWGEGDGLSSYEADVGFRGGTVQFLHISEWGEVQVTHRAKSKEIRDGSLPAVERARFATRRSPSRLRTAGTSTSRRATGGSRFGSTCRIRCRGSVGSDDFASAHTACKCCVVLNMRNMSNLFSMFHKAKMQKIEGDHPTGAAIPCQDAGQGVFNHYGAYVESIERGDVVRRTLQSGFAEDYVVEDINHSDDVTGKPKTEFKVRKVNAPPKQRAATRVEFHGPVHSTNLQIGDYNSIQVHQFFADLERRIDSANASEPDKAEARTRLQRFLEHPVTVGIISAMASKVGG